MPAQREQQLLSALSGGERTAGEVRETLNLSVHRTTVQRWLEQLAASGAVEKVPHGKFRLQGSAPGLTESGREVLGVVEDLAPDAHLTGFDPLARYAHQFFVEFPHLVYVEPASADTAAFRLAEAGFLVVRARGHWQASAVSARPAQTVILRAQPNAEQYGVRSSLAAPEKAWVDTLRESQRGFLPFDHVELGRVLRALLDDGGDLRKLRNYARRMGYQARVAAALGQAPPHDTEDEALRAGFLS